MRKLDPASMRHVCLADLVNQLLIHHSGYINRFRGGVMISSKYWFYKGVAVALLATACIAQNAGPAQKDSKSAKKMAALKADSAMATADTKTNSSDLSATRRELFSEHRI